MKRTLFATAVVALAATFHCALAAESKEANQPKMSAPTPEIAGGSRDFGNAETDVVVQIVSPNRICTGTLVTPMAVLTARHCVNGDDEIALFPLPPHFKNPPIQYPVLINIGDQNGSPLRQYTSNNITPSKTWADGPQTVGNPGNDIAVIFLDPPGTTLPGAKPGPAFDYAQIVHPTLTSPCPSSGCGDSDGGSYSPPLGMAGWAPQDAGAFRQIAVDTEFNHYPGRPTDRGQYWTHVQGSIHANPGDSGGPLFARRPHPTIAGAFYRDVIGVLNGDDHNTPGHDYDLWVDITRGAIAQWVREALGDSIPRGPVWKAFHPNLIWYGDVDYLGPCRIDVDADCDHIFDNHDNCPIYNPDQRDTLDNGIGDACRNLPPPPPPPPNATDIPKNCLASARGCGSEVTLLCEGGGREMPLDVKVISDDASSPSFVPATLVHPQATGGYFSFKDLTSISKGVYQLCLQNDHAVCGDAYQVSFLPAYHDACESGGGGGAGGGGGGGGGPPVNCHPHCPQ